MFEAKQVDGKTIYRLIRPVIHHFGEPWEFKEFSSGISVINDRDGNEILSADDIGGATTLRHIVSCINMCAGK